MYDFETMMQDLLLLCVCVCLLVFGISHTQYGEENCISCKFLFPVFDTECF